MKKELKITQPAGMSDKAFGSMVKRNNMTDSAINALATSIERGNQPTPTKSLNERIAECKDKAATILASDPEISEVVFSLNDCDIDQIKEHDKSPEVAVYRLRGLVLCMQNGCTIWANTKPFKAVKPLEYEF